MNFSLQISVLTCHVNDLFFQALDDLVSTLESRRNLLLYHLDLILEKSLHAFHLFSHSDQAGVRISESIVETALATRRGCSKLVRVDLHLVHLIINNGK